MAKDEINAEGKAILFTDGASRGNPGRGGWGSIVIAGGHVTELGGFEANTTNNRMELRSLIEALTFLDKPESGFGVGMPITVYLDSSYVMNGAMKWIASWMSNNWMTAAKKEVLNKDMWQELVLAMRGKKVDFHLLPGHAEIRGNERVDKIATGFADGKPPKLFSGTLEDYGQGILDISYNREVVDNRRARDNRRTLAKAYSYVSMVNGKIETHKTWPECEARVRGASGARFKKALSAGEEQEIIAMFQAS